MKDTPYTSTGDRAESFSVGSHGTTELPQFAKEDDLAFEAERQVKPEKTLHTGSRAES